MNHMVLILFLSLWLFIFWQSYSALNIEQNSWTTPKPVAVISKMFWTIEEKYKVSFECLSMDLFELAVYFLQELFPNIWRNSRWISLPSFISIIIIFLFFSAAAAIISANCKHLNPFEVVDHFIKGCWVCIVPDEVDGVWPKFSDVWVRWWFHSWLLQCFILFTKNV